MQKTQLKALCQLGSTLSRAGTSRRARQLGFVSSMTLECLATELIQRSIGFQVMSLSSLRAKLTRQTSAQFEAGPAKLLLPASLPPRLPITISHPELSQFPTTFHSLSLMPSCCCLVVPVRRGAQDQPCARDTSSTCFLFLPSFAIPAALLLSLSQSTLTG